MHDYTYLIRQLLGERLGGKRVHFASVFLFLFLTAVFGSSFVLGWTHKYVLKTYVLVDDGRGDALHTLVLMRII